MNYYGKHGRKEDNRSRYRLDSDRYWTEAVFDEIELDGEDD